MALKLSKDDAMYMNIARVVALRSRDEHFKVGAVIAKGNKILSYGWNGTPHGMDNATRDANGKTKWELVHAETNAIAKLAASTSSSEDATLYLTHSPCKDCTKLILQAGIKRMIYAEIYKSNKNGKRVPELEALKFLLDNGVEVHECETLK